MSNASALVDPTTDNGVFPALLLWKATQNPSDKKPRHAWNVGTTFLLGCLSSE